MVTRHLFPTQTHGATLPKIMGKTFSFDVATLCNISCGYQAQKAEVILRLRQAIECNSPNGKLTKLIVHISCMRCYIACLADDRKGNIRSQNLEIGQQIEIGNRNREY